MIRLLRLENFRRHADTELRFDKDAQLVLVAGRNGSGKTSVLEALTYGLYGEGRHGRRNLDRLVRRGAELEGMSVEVEFEVDGTVYRVERRRDNQMSTAVLYSNGVSLIESPKAVTDQVTQLLGMDVAGFRLAVLAQQKELDGLASLRPAERAKMLSRLLRLDALQVAKDNARGEYRDHRTAVAALGSPPDLDELREQVEDAEKRHDQAKTALDAAREAVARFEGELTELKDVEARYQEAMQARARAEGQLDAAREQLTAAESSLAGHEIPAPLDVSVRPLADIAADRELLERRIAEAEAAARAADQLAVIREDHDAAVARLGEIDDWFAAHGTRDEMEDHAAKLTSTHASAQARAAEVRGKVDELRGDVAVLSDRAKQLAGQVGRVDDVGAECDQCGQEVTDEHRADLQERLEAQRTDTEEQLTRSQGLLADAEEEATTLDTRVADLAEQLSSLRGMSDEAEKLTQERDAQQRRAQVYADQMSRAPEVTVDIDTLHEERNELDAERADAVKVEDRNREIADAVRRERELTATVDAAKERVSAAEGLLADAGPTVELQDAHEQFLTTSEVLAEESSLASELATNLAVADEQRGQAVRALEAAEQAHEKVRSHQRSAQVASLSSEVLGAVHHRLSMQVRPALEGTVSQLLATMSDGRFTRVEITEDYDIRVEDDGRSRPLSEVSGGESDLIALAVRLALAGVVSDRHGSGGPGFLVLDECFGSQDVGRRLAILDALRTLRGRFGQIFLISHVGGIEDAADLVIDVERDEESGCSITSTT